MSCQGKPIEMQDLKTAQQKQMMEKMGPLIWEMMGKGATPFGGQLTQGPDQGMLQAMNMMSMMGGQGPYQVPGMQTGAYPPPPGMNIPPWNQNWSDTTTSQTTTEKTDTPLSESDERGSRGRWPGRGVGRGRRDPYAAF